MAKQQNNEEQILLETIGKAESFLEKNKNVLIYGVGGFAGAQTGQPVFAEIAHMLINNYDVKPKKS